MTTRRRLNALKNWLWENTCKGRMLKSPDSGMDVTRITKQEPQVYLAWHPRRPDQTGRGASNPVSVCPGIIIMPTASYAKNMEEERFDRYNGIHRPGALGQTLQVSMLFSVYEPGVRLPGYTDDPHNLSLLMEGTEEGLFTLTDWIDDCIRKLLGQRIIPGSDLFLHEADTTYSLYEDQNYVVDKRPIFYGYINAVFGCYADDSLNSSVNDLLR